MTAKRIQRIVGGMIKKSEIAPSLDLVVNAWDAAIRIAEDRLPQGTGGQFTAHDHELICSITDVMYAERGHAYDRAMEQHRATREAWLEELREIKVDHLTNLRLVNTVNALTAILEKP